MAPKASYTGPIETRLAVELAVLLFNIGFKECYQRVYENVGLPVTENMLQTWNGIDELKMKYKATKEKDTVQQRRKQLKRKNIKKNEAFIHEESGMQYSSGAFHGGKRTKKK